MDEITLKATMKFLVVDDSTMIRKFIIGSLRNEGFNGIIYEAADGLEGLNVFNEKRVDCIVLDWNMPKMDGLEFVQRAREKAGSQNVFILMLTGERAVGKMEIALHSGADDYLSKPYTPEEFRRKMEKMLAKLLRK